jgi:hypothetical protein
VRQLLAKERAQTVPPGGREAERDRYRAALEVAVEGLGSLVLVDDRATDTLVDIRAVLNRGEH